MSSAFSCSVCTENFDVAEHKPRCLPCGHTFCLDCVRRLDSAKSRSCYSCCRPVNQSTEQLPVVYALIGLEENEATVRCKFHTHELEYWCVPCKESLCKKCVKVQHGGHRVEFMEDLMDNEACAADAKAEIYCQLKAKQDRLSSAFSVRAEILRTLEEGKSVIAKISNEKDLIAASKKSVDKDVETWESGTNTPSTAEGKRQLFRDIVHRSKEVKAPKDEEILQLKNKLAHLEKAMAFLSSDDCEQQFLHPTDNELVGTSEGKTTNQDAGKITGRHPPENDTTEAASSSTPASPAEPLSLSDDHWQITNDAEAEQAVTDVRAGLMPRELTVISTLTDPILGLPEILLCLGRACSGNINLKLLDTFWAPESVPSENFQTFIEELG